MPPGNANLPIGRLTTARPKPGNVALPSGSRKTANQDRAPLGKVPSGMEKRANRETGDPRGRGSRWVFPDKPEVFGSLFCCWVYVCRTLRGGRIWPI